MKHRHKGRKLWTRSFVLICMVCLFSGLAMNMLNSTLAKYIYSIYGNASFSGLLNAAFAIMAILGRLVSGNLSDRLGRRSLMIAGCLIFAAAAFCFGVFPWAAMLIIFRGLQGLGYSVTTTADYAAGADVIPPERLTEGIGYIGIGYCLATAVGPALALKLLLYDGYMPMFAGAALMILIACGCAAAIRSPSASGAPPNTGSSGLRLSKLIEPKALPATLIQFLNCMSFAAINSFIVLYGEALEYTHVSVFFTCMAAAMICTRLLSGRITDRTGPRYVVSVSFAMSILGFVLLLFVHSEPVFYLVGFLMGFSTGTANPVLQAVAIKASPVTRRGAASGTFQLSNDIANGLGALLWGLLIDLLGYTSMFVGCIVFLVLALLCVLVIFRKQFSR